MPDDAKLGLLAGVAVVILGAVVYMPKPAAPPTVVETAPEPAVAVPVALSPPIVPERDRVPAAMTASFARPR